MVARWLTEEWNGEEQVVPTWLRTRVWQEFTMRDFGNPNAMAREICLRLLKDHKKEMSLRSGNSSKE